MQLSQRKAFLISLMVLVFLVLGRMAPPLEWSQTHLMFSYDSGFQRRALIGEVLTWVFPEGMSLSSVYLVSVGMTLLGVLAMFLFAAHGYFLSRSGNSLLVLFATSVGLATYVGNTGNLSGVMTALAVLSMLAPASFLGILFRVIACMLGGMVHEIMLPVYATLICAELFLRLQERPLSYRLKMSAIPLCGSLVITVVLFKYGTHPYKNMAEVLEIAQMRALDFDVLRVALEPIVEPSPGLGRSFDSVWGSSYYKFRLFAFGGIGFGIWLIHAFVLWRLMSKSHVLERVAMLLVAFAPFSLLLVAFDVSRFISLSILNTLLLISVVLRYKPSAREMLSEVLTPGLVIFLLVVNGNIALRDLNQWKQYRVDFPANTRSLIHWKTDTCDIWPDKCKEKEETSLPEVVQIKTPTKGK